MSSLFTEHTTGSPASNTFRSPWLKLLTKAYNPTAQ
jgi:hypothetical protein